MQLNLTDAGTQALKVAIDSYYSDLREEIYHTEDHDARETLKSIEQALADIREQLEPGWRASMAAAEPAAAPAAPPATG